MVESRSVKRNAKNVRGLGRDRAAATAPFPKSCTSYFRSARFNMFPLYYLRAWHRLVLEPLAQCGLPVLMYDFSTYYPEADGTDSTFCIPPSKENGCPVVTNKQKALNFIPVDLFNRFTVKSPKIRVMSPDILSHVARNK